MFERRCDPRFLRRMPSSLPGPLEGPGRVGRLHWSFLAFGVRGSRWWWQRWLSGACWGQREKESRLNPQTHRLVLDFCWFSGLTGKPDLPKNRVGRDWGGDTAIPLQSLSPHMGSQSLGKKGPHCVPGQAIFRAQIGDKNYQLWLAGLRGRLYTVI